MGQKINPTLIRLQYTNKFFDSCWYSHYFYTNLIHQDLQIQSYFNAILKQIQYPSARFFIQHISKKSKINIFFCNSSNLQNLRFKFFQITKYKKNNRKLLIGNFIKNYQYHKQKYFFYLFQNIKFQNLHFLQKQLYFRFLLLLYLQTRNKNKFFAKNLFLHKIQRFQLLNNFEKTTIPLSELYIKKNLLSNKKIHLQTVLIKSLINKNLPLLLLNSNTKNFCKSGSRVSIGYSKKYILIFYKNLNNILNQTEIKYNNIPYLKYKQSLLFFYNKLNNNFLLNKKQNITKMQNILTVPSQNDYANKLKNVSTIQPFEEKVYSKKTIERPALLGGSNSSGIIPSKTLLSLKLYEKFFDFNLIKEKKFNKKILIKNFKFREHLESIISKKIESSTNISLFKCINDYQNATFLAEELVYYLEKKVTFRKIKSRILKEVENHQIIKGIRITFSGRVGGKSKKAQRAKTECIKYGQTSLHVFSEKIDFASKKACTPFGILGIKVWICFN